MTKDPLVFIDHIKESVLYLEKYSTGIKKRDFRKSVQLQDSIIRRFEIIGEAARNVPADFRKQHKEFNWQDIVDFRNKLIHDYFGIDFDLVWKILKKDLPALKSKLQKIPSDLTF